jgi:peptide/nickel transport system permease protein
MVAIAERLGRKPIDKDSAEERLYVASQWRLMWLKFRRHKLALIGAAMAITMYLMAAFNGFLSPYDPLERTRFAYAGYHGIHFIDSEGKFIPHVYGLALKADPNTMTRTFVEDPTKEIPIQFFAKGSEYTLLGFITWDVHLFKAAEGGDVFLLGTDKLGRDVFSRVLSGATISLSIGLVGVLISFMLGAVIGGFSGFYGGAFDTVVQRIIEFLLAMPTIPLWMALSAAVPKNWTAEQVYLSITIILSLQGWCSMARVVRGKLLQIREEDFVMEAKLGGATDWRIVVVHMLPAFMSYLIVHMTLAIPNMILGETALSFLGLGLRPPVVSWGVLLQDAQNIRTVALNPWLLSPAAFVIAIVLAFNFLGDGLRDAADPYKS